MTDDSSDYREQSKWGGRQRSTSHGRDRMRDYSDRESERWKPVSSRGASRWLVAQSIAPGIFRPREEGQSQSDYGGVEGKDVVANTESFVPLFEKMSRAMRVKKHNVWDKEGKKHEVVASVETKGLLGTEEKYVLDLYRTTSLDADFLEKHWKGVEGEEAEKGYPHRMAVLRPELVEIFGNLRCGSTLPPKWRSEKWPRRRSKRTLVKRRLMPGRRARARPGVKRPSLSQSSLPILLSRRSLEKQESPDKEPPCRTSERAKARPSAHSR